MKQYEFTPRVALLVIAVLLNPFSPLNVARTDAAQVDLLLDVAYDNPDNPVSGGHWSLYVKASDFGLASLQVPLVNVPATLELSAPRGYEVDWDRAFLVSGFAVSNNTGPTAVMLLQQDYGPSLDPPRWQPVFYGVGSVQNGTPTSIWSMPPDFPASYSPELPPFVTGSPWATSSPHPGWETAAKMLGGQFPGRVQSYYQGPTQFYLEPWSTFGLYEARVFETLPILDWQFPEQSQFVGQVAGADMRLFVRDNRPLAGDFNQDGAVDAADYTTWRDTHGSLGDYEQWKTNFGSTSLQEIFPGVTIPAPEPTSVWATSITCLISLGYVRLNRVTKRGVR